MPRGKELMKGRCLKRRSLPPAQRWNTLGAGMLWRRPVRQRSLSRYLDYLPEASAYIKFDPGGAMLSVPLSPEIEEKLAALANSRGQSKSDFARQLIEASIEDLDDIETAVGRVENRQPPLTAEQARKALGLDD
jgi:predicted DNA-binding protein